MSHNQQPASGCRADQKVKAGDGYDVIGLLCENGVNPVCWSVLFSLTTSEKHPNFDIFKKSLALGADKKKISQRKYTLRGNPVT